MALTPGIKGLRQGRRPLKQSYEQRQFSKEDFHSLNVTRVGILAAYDLLDCIFECLKNALCLSINMAALKGAGGKLCCELLSSDKYRDAENYNENASSRHFSILVRTFCDADAVGSFKGISIIHSSYCISIHYP